MNKLLKYLWSVLVTICVVFGMLFVAMIFLFDDAATSCGEDSESVAYARELPDQRLAKLYYDIEKYSEDSSTPYSDLKAGSEGKFPEPFSDIHAIRIRPKQENIMLNGCFDHYVYLSFHGLKSNREYKPKRQIVLSWGEHERAGSEVVWSE